MVINCDGIDKKKDKNCELSAKYIVNIDNKKHYRCGRHSRNMDNKELIDNIVKEKKKRGRKPKMIKNDKNKDSNIEKENENNNVNNNIQEKISHQDENINNFNNEINNKYRKIEILFTKMDELCNLLSNNIINE